MLGIYLVPLCLPALRYSILYYCYPALQGSDLPVAFETNELGVTYYIVGASALELRLEQGVAKYPLWN